MDINIYDRSTMLILGGLAFTFLSFVKVEGYQIFLIVPEGNKKYLLLFGILFIIIGIFVPMNDSEHQNNGSAIIINNNNNLTQTITSGQKESVSIETPAVMIALNVGTKYESHHLEL